MARADRSHASGTLAGFDDHARAIAKRQYFQPGDASLEDMFARVASWVASPEPEEARAEMAERFYDLMIEKRFCPGGRVLAGAATGHGNVLNCFVQDGSPEEAGTTPWVMRLATKLALVTKVGGGNGLNLDPIQPKRAFERVCGRLYLTIDPSHDDYEKVRSGTFFDLVRGEYVARGYRSATFVERRDGPSGVQLRAVGDSVEGIWRSGSDMIQTLLRGEDVLLDLSDLRPEGTPVKGSGGSSSGPSSFAVEVFDNFAMWASLGGAEYAGPVATLRYVYAPTLRVIRQGGTRRGAGMATMSITHPDVRDFITAKDLDREQAEGDISTFNISVLVSDAFMTQSIAREGGDVLEEIARHAWQTGEPGLIYVDRINQFNPMRQALGDIKSTNPCVTADTWVHTHMGARRVRDLVGRDFCAVVDGKRYGLESRGFFSTGVKPVFKVRTRRGYELRLTADHPLRMATGVTRGTVESQWVPLGALAAGDRIVLADQRDAPLWAGPGSEAEGWALGMLVGDGTFFTDKPGVAALDFSGEDAAERAEKAAALLRELGYPLSKQWVTHSGTHEHEPGERRSRVASQTLGTLASRFGLVRGEKTVTDEVEGASGAFAVGFLRGLFDGEGSVRRTQAEGVSVRLAQSDLELLKRAQRMLARLGVLSALHQGRRPAGASRSLDGRGAAHECPAEARHELVVSGGNLRTFAGRVGFTEAAKRERLAAALKADHGAPDRERFVDAIAAIEPDGEEEVFDVTVERVHEFDANGLRAHNCGEIPLYPGEPCDLGAMNLAAYVVEPGKGMAGFDEPSFRADVGTCIRFLDNVLDVNRFALEDNRVMSMRLRRLGLGVMGLADALIRMGYAYNSDEGRAAVDAMIGSLRDAATEASETLGKERGTFPLMSESALDTPRRNVAVLTVAPTGTTSMLMGVSSGVEPVFAPFIYRKIGNDYAALVHPLFRELMSEHVPHPDYASGEEWDWDKVVEAVQDNHGSVQGLDFIPDAVKAVLICAHDISASDHVRMQGVVQQAFDGGKMVANSISKTINAPKHATVQDVFDAYTLAFETGCKGITVYRDGSREFQVLSTKAAKPAERKPVTGDAAKAAAAAVAAAPAAPLASEPPAAASRADRLPSEPLFERPLRLSGFTDAVKLMLPNGEKRGFFVTVNNQDGLPTEVFIVSGKAGDEANADSEALGRVVSIALQYGVPAEALIKTLRGINGGMYGSYHGRLVASKADLIAVALETAGAENVLNRGKACPDCGAPLRFEEGCQKCENCGYSKCG